MDFVVIYYSCVRLLIDKMTYEIRETVCRNRILFFFWDFVQLISVSNWDIFRFIIHSPTFDFVLCASTIHTKHTEHIRNKRRYKLPHFTWMAYNQCTSNVWNVKRTSVDSFSGCEDSWEYYVSTKKKIAEMHDFLTF